MMSDMEQETRNMDQKDRIQGDEVEKGASEDSARDLSPVEAEETEDSENKEYTEETEGELSDPKPLPEKKKGFFGACKERLHTWKQAFSEAVNERSTEIRHAKAKRVLFFVVLIVFIACFVAFYFTVGKKIAFFIKDRDGFKEWLESFGSGSVLVFIALRVVQTVLKLIPGEALEIAAGCIFGAWEGLLWCLVGSLIGSVIIIFLTKKYGMRLVGLFVSPKKMQEISFLKNKKRLNFTFFLLYFIPGTPKDMFTWLIGLTDENVFLFVLLTTIARIPSIITSTWCGQELVNGNYVLSAWIFAATVLLAVGGGLIYKFVGNKKKEK